MMLMIKYYVLIIAVVFMGQSCSHKTKQQQVVSAKTMKKSSDSYQVKYAKGFTVEVYPDYKLVSLRNPWDTLKILKKYVLVEKSKKLPAVLPEGEVVRIPLTDVVVYSTIHCSTMDEIGEMQTIRGVCEPQYIDIPYIKDAVGKGKIIDLGKAAGPDVEKIIEISPEAIWATPIQGRTYGSVDKTKIPIIETPDYMENSSLGRAEWIRFYSLFFDKEALADSLFAVTETNYNHIKSKVSNVDYKPTVFLDLMYKGVWYASGGNSFISEMLSDAGATYVWHSNGKGTSTPLAFEQVLDEAGNAQFWLIKYNKPYDLTYGKLKEEYVSYSYFDAYKNKNIYECNTAYSKYYEDLPIHPDYILQDFAYIFHPELFSGYKPRYYYKMKD